MRASLYEHGGEKDRDCMIHVIPHARFKRVHCRLAQLRFQPVGGKSTDRNSEKKPDGS